LDTFFSPRKVQEQAHLLLSFLPSFLLVIQSRSESARDGKITVAFVPFSDMNGSFFLPSGRHFGGVFSIEQQPGTPAFSFFPPPLKRSR